MSAPESAEEAQRWLTFAQQDLLEAEALMTREEAIPRHACWFAQQAAEKALKAALVLEDIEFPFGMTRCVAEPAPRRLAGEGRAPASC